MLSLSRTTRFASFPDYLVIQIKKFTFGLDWVPKKLGMLSGWVVMEKVLEKGGLNMYQLVFLRFFSEKGSILCMFQNVSSLKRY